MKTIDIEDAKEQISYILSEIEKEGDTFRIVSKGKPVADIVPPIKTDRTTPHPVMRQIRINYDPTEALSENDWPEND